MCPSFSPGGYVEPGAYVQVQNVAIPNVQPGQRTGAITGTGKLTKNIMREAVALSRTGSGTLIDPYTAFSGTLSNIPIIDLLVDDSGNYYVTDAAGKMFYKTLDFTYATSTGIITWLLSPTNGFPEMITDSQHATIYVNYTVTKTALDYQAKYFDSLDSVITEYGDIDPDKDGVVENTLPLLAQIFFENGGTQLYCSQTIPITKIFTFDHTTGQLDCTGHGLVNGNRVMLASTDGGTFPTDGVNPMFDSVTVYYVVNKATDTFKLASTLGGAPITFANNGTGHFDFTTQDNDILAAHLNALANFTTVDAYCLIPGFSADATAPNDAIISTVKQQIIQMSTVTERKNRVGVIGGFSTTDNPLDPNTAVATFIAGIRACDYYRMAYVVPANATKTLTYGQVVLSGPYIAAAVAGIICNNSFSAGEPISGKSLAGFDSISDIYTRYQKNRMASYGGMVIENVSGNYKIRHALSTDISDIVKAELKITRITDSVSYTVRTSLESMFVNTRNTGAQTISNISSATTLILDSIVSIQDIVAYKNLSVVQSTIDPRQINVSFEIQPAWDVNYILITFGVTV